MILSKLPSRNNLWDLVCKAIEEDEDEEEEE
jgi:hypothetical protein